MDSAAGSAEDTPAPTTLPAAGTNAKKSVVVVDGDCDTELPFNPSPGEHATKIFQQTIVSDSSETSESWSERAQELSRLAEESEVTKGRKPNRRASDTSDLEEVMSGTAKKVRKKKKPEHSDTDTSIESRVEMFRKSLSNRKSNRHLSSSSESSSPARRRVSRKTTSRSSHGGSRKSRRSFSSEGSFALSAKSSVSNVRLPSFLKQPLPRGTDAPVELKEDPHLHKRKKSGWESVADALAARDGPKEGDAEPTYPRLLERALFALRGFGCFDVAWGIGSYGKNFTELIRRIGSDNSEDLRLNHIKCKITNRIAVGFSTLKFGAKKLGFEDEKNLLLGDFTQVSNSILEEHILVSATAEKKPGQPKMLEQFRRCAENQINLRCLFFGEQYRDERGLCLKNLFGT